MIWPSLGGLYSIGGGQSSTAHWHRSTQCEPHSSTPPPSVLRPIASTSKPPIMPPPFSKLNPSSSLALYGRHAEGPRYISQSTTSFAGSGSAGNQPLIIVSMPRG